MTKRSLAAFILALAIGLAASLCRPVLSATVPDSSGTIQCGILQYAHGRLYFPVGEESNVYPGSKVMLMADSEHVGALSIEHSWIGISATYPITTASKPIDSLDVAAALDTLDINRLTALIATAAVDSAATAVIGTDIAGLANLLRLNDTSRITIREYAYRAGMVEDFKKGMLDGCLSFQDFAPSESTDKHVSPAPFIATLVPNVGRDCNRGGRLTTSLYYRFDPAKLGLMFHGDSARAQNTFHIYQDSTSVDRWFPFDPERGRTLFASADQHPQLVRVYYASETLKPTAFFFSDIIARDKCRVELTTEPNNADLYVSFVPVSIDLPSITMYTLHRRFIRDSLPGRPEDDNIRQISAYFRFVENPSDIADYYHNLEAAERVALDDIGAFPLFRPSLFMVTRKDIQGLTFANDGRLDDRHMVRVLLPGTSPVITESTR